jgi:hypothetical protein
MKTAIKNKVQHIAKQCAQKLNDKTEQWSDTKKKIALFLFCTICASISTYVIIETINSKNVSSIYFHRVDIPVQIGKPSDKMIQPNYSVPDFERIEGIKKYLDSISTNDSIKYAEIIRLRPHLMDSILLFEKLYLLQSKNKNGN